MISVQASTTIDRSVEEVFRVASSVEERGKWATGMVESKAGSVRHVDVGIEFAGQTKIALWTLDTDCQVIASEPDLRIRLTARSNALEYVRELVFTATRGGWTRVESSGTVSLFGRWRLFKPLVSREVQRESHAELGRLKRLLAEAPAPTA